MPDFLFASSRSTESEPLLPPELLKKQSRGQWFQLSLSTNGLHSAVHFSCFLKCNSSPEPHIISLCELLWCVDDFINLGIASQFSVPDFLFAAFSSTKSRSPLLPDLLKKRSRGQRFQLSFSTYGLHSGGSFLLFSKNAIRLQSLI